MVDATKTPPAEDMAQFEDRFTVRYVRLLPAPVHRVWQAVTRSEELDVWFMPITRVEARLGGRCFLSWGRAEADVDTIWTVTRFEPLRVFELSEEPDRFQFLRFELESVDAKTRFTFTNRFNKPASDHDLALAAANPDNKLLSLPAGNDTPIRAGILEGYHLIFDGFGRFLSHTWAEGQLAEISAGLVARANEAAPERFAGADAGPSPLAELYYDYIREHCPPA